MPSALLAKWSEETFRFLPQKQEGDSLEEFRTLLAEEYLPVNMAPTYIPGKYVFQYVDSNDSEILHKVFAAYQDGDRPYLIIEIQKWADPSYITDVLFEKDSSTVNSHIVNGRQFYLFTNLELHNTVWSDSTYVISITGASSRDDLIAIANSIQE